MRKNIELLLELLSLQHQPLWQVPFQNVALATDTIKVGILPSIIQDIGRAIDYLR